MQKKRKKIWEYLPAYNLTNGVWWASQNRTPRAVILTQSSRATIPYSKIASWVVFAFLCGIVSCNVFNNKCYAESSATLTIGQNNLSTTVTQGDVAYLSSTITASGTDIENYTLSITGPVGLTGGTAITGANNKTPANMANNTWGYAYNQSGNNDTKAYSSFTGSSQTLETGTTPSGQAKNITFVAKFASNATPAHYTGSVVVSLVATPKVATTYTLTYNLNGGNISGSTTNPTQTCTTYDNSCNITMSYTSPTKSGYNFLGWADSSSATSASSSYGSGKSISMSENKTIYAVWQWNGTTQSGFSSITNMQQMTSSICSSANIGDTKSLKDTRDSSYYTVVKMPDGKCWMTSNLKIMGSRILTSSDSDVSSNWALPASSTSGFSNSAASNAYLSGGTGYYTWCAATAGTCTSATSGGQNAPSSICPKGWKLPSGGSSGEFQTFTAAAGIAADAAGSTKIKGTPYDFAYTGNMDNSSLRFTDSSGRWWSRTAYNGSYAYGLYVDGNYTSYVSSTNGYSDRCYGFAVRCVAQ